ncbi:MAG: hypothetical protein WCF36_07450 [Candidatus Nanopelagicales bacterium]
MGDLVWILVLAAAAVFVMRSMRPQQPARELPGAAANRELAERRWQAVRRVAEEDVTQLGEQIADTPVPASIEPEAAHDFDAAFTSYERAKEAMAAASHPDDLQWVSRSLDDGRFALATLAARRDGRELPSRRPACFFDQRHGLSVADAQWAPDGGALRDVPVCAACQARIADGLDPQARLVPTAAGDRPYYDAGPEYAPWARGWYGASGMYMLNNMLLGTMLINAMYLPAGFDYFGADGGAGGGADGGADGAQADGGADTAGDASGGFDDGGGFDGGGFDGGGFDFGGF